MKREYLPSDDAGRAAADWPVPPGAAFYAVRLGGRQVGLASTTVDTATEGLKVSERLRLDLPVPDDTAPRRIMIRTDLLLSRNLRLRSWHTDVIENNATATASGRVVGDSVLVLENQVGKRVDTIRVTLARAPVPPVALPFRVVYAKELQLGRSYEVTVFDPVDFSLRTQRIAVAAESVFVVADSSQFDSLEQRWVVAHLDTVKAWRLDGLERGLPVRRWVDAQGLMVQSRTPLGLTLERSTFEIVSENYRRAQRRERKPAGPGVSLQPPGPGPKRSTPALDSLAVRMMEPQPLLLRGPVPALDEGSQHRTGDTLAVRRIERSNLGVSPVATPPAVDSTTIRDFLEADPLIDSRDPVVQAAASRIVDTERSPVLVAERLTHWVARTILRGQETVALTGAARTLKSRQGDTRAHAVLLAALARASGIPARLAAGVIRRDGAFHYYTWAEVYLEGWVPVDPTLDQFPADASHLRLTIGSPGRAADLVPYVGQVRLELLEQK